MQITQENLSKYVGSQASIEYHDTIIYKGEIANVTISGNIMALRFNWLAATSCYPQSRSWRSVSFEIPAIDVADYLIAMMDDGHISISSAFHGITIDFFPRNGNLLDRAEVQDA